MQITKIQICNFKSIENMQISDVENALILVGKNNTGKTAVLDAIRAFAGGYKIQLEDFHEDYPNVEITVTLSFSTEDLLFFHRQGKVSNYRNFKVWYRTFCSRFPSYVETVPMDKTDTTIESENRKVVKGEADLSKNNSSVKSKAVQSNRKSNHVSESGNVESGYEFFGPAGELTFTFIANRNGQIRYSDGDSKHNTRIQEILPEIYYIDTQRNLEQFQKDLLLMQEDELLKSMRSGCCLFNRAKKCNNCFSCIGLINQKKTEELNAFEVAKLLDYKLYQLNLNTFSRRVNENYRKNGGQEQIIYSMNRDVEQMLSVTAEFFNEQQAVVRPVSQLGKGMRSIYMLSLLETYSEGQEQSPGIILVEEPELFLHPKLQKVSGELLYQLSRKNQVIFSTHSPNLLPSFNSKQIRQVVLNMDGYSSIRRETNISVILNDLGYSANDLMNVDFVFIVEGRQDKSRLPLLLKKYYSEMYDEDGRLSRVAIITTNSCTNIKTYANLKYMNQVYLKDNFLMIRDGDGKDGEELKRQLCKYYDERKVSDTELPRVREKNILILKYYSFENYFLNPEIMAAIGVLKRPEDFYQIFLKKWKEYLSRIKSGQKLKAVLGKDLETVEDVKEHMEEIKVHMRGHNLYDLFYGRYKKQETEILKKYIDLADRNEFKDILDAIDRFIYFENRALKM